MKLLKKNLFVLWCIVIMVVTPNVYSQILPPPDYPDIIVEQPEGELVYYEATCRYYPTENSTFTEDKTLVIPTVFGNNGDVFMRNPIGENFSMATWIKGEIDDTDGSLVFPLGNPVAYRFRSYNYYYIILLSLADLSGDKIENNIEGNIKFESLSDGTYRFYSGDETKALYREIKAQGENPDAKSEIQQDFIVEMTLCPVDFEPVMPPSDCKVEEYQLSYKSYQGCFIKTAEPDKVRIVNVVRDNDDYYIQGLGTWDNGGDPEAWIKGYVKYDRIYFPNYQKFGVSYNSTYSVLNTFFKISSGYEPYYDYLGHAYMGCDGKGDDLIFQHDVKNERLYNPYSDFGIYDIPTEKILVDINLSDPLFMDMFSSFDLYEGAILQKIPEEKIRYPQEPVIKYNDYYKRYNVELSLFDTEGFVLDPSSLYLKVWQNGEPYIFTSGNVGLYTDNAFEPTDELLFDILYYQKRFHTPWISGADTRILRIDYINSMYDTYFYFEPTDIEVIYKKDGIEYSSKGTTTGVEGFNSDSSFSSKQDGKVYNLNGQRVNPDNLLPGIYIRNGRKFVVK